MKKEGNEWVVANEFARIHIKKIETINGMQLEINSPRLGYKIVLDPLELESLTWQHKDLFTKLLETPFGPQ
ncbi:dihydrodiol dehydrogenase [Neobacillus niacini]|uniref:dihydrodiol dehydrogenase n=1 Tax=Neobacillus niacini TaxID=86668 RepID=UPI002FFFB395